MWRYLRAAFLVGVEVPGLGRLPLNALAVAGVAILGVAEPSMWLAGLGLEAAFVSSLAFNGRFQRLTDGIQAQRRLGGEAAQVSALVAGLPAELAARLQALRRSSARAMTILRSQGTGLGAPDFDAGTAEGAKASLDRLEWLYLKLLVARNHLVNELGEESLAALTERITRMEQESASSGSGGTVGAAEGLGTSTALARSQEATLVILRRRAENLKNRDRFLRENASDLERIEAQVDLMRENAAIEGKPVAVETEIELASDLASPDLFGAQSSLVKALDERRG